MNDERPLIAVTVRSTERNVYPGMPGGYAQRAVVVGQSRNRDASFEFQTGLLNVEAMEKCLQLQQHGFTAVEAPDNWRYGYYNEPGGWQHAVIVLAMERVSNLYKQERGNAMGYNAELAERVLMELDKAFPGNPVQTLQLKHALALEPSDDELLTALDALHLRGMIDWKPLRGHTTATRTLVAMANIQITAKGHDHIHGIGQSSAPNVVIQGDQINAHGQIGSIGRHSQGVVNVHPRWQAIAAQFDITTLASELEQLRMAYQKVASSREDVKQLALLVDAVEEAEKGNGERMAANLSRIGTNVLKVAREIGTDIAAKVIVELSKPS